MVISSQYIFYHTALTGQVAAKVFSVSIFGISVTSVCLPATLLSIAEAFREFLVLEEKLDVLSIDIISGEAFNCL